MWSAGYGIFLIFKNSGLDVKGHAETASGKSAAFLLPIIDKIMKKKQEGEFVSKRGAPFALIIEPTRELTIQIHEESQKLANGILYY